MSPLAGIVHLTKSEDGEELKIPQGNTLRIHVLLCSATDIAAKLFGILQSGLL